MAGTACARERELSGDIPAGFATEVAGYRRRGREKPVLERALGGYSSRGLKKRRATEVVGYRAVYSEELEEWEGRERNEGRRSRAYFRNLITAL